MCKRINIRNLTITVIDSQNIQDCGTKFDFIRLYNIDSFLKDKVNSVHEAERVNCSFSEKEQERGKGTGNPSVQQAKSLNGGDLRPRTFRGEQIPWKVSQHPRMHAYAGRVQRVATIPRSEIHGEKLSPTSDRNNCPDTCVCAHLGELTLQDA